MGEKDVKRYVCICMGLGLMNASRSPGPRSWVNHDVIPSPVTMETAVNDVIAVSAWPSFARRWGGRRAFDLKPPLSLVGRVRIRADKEHSRRNRVLTGDCRDREDVAYSDDNSSGSIV